MGFYHFPGPKKIGLKLDLNCPFRLYFIPILAMSFSSGGKFGPAETGQRVYGQLHESRYFEGFQPMIRDRLRHGLSDVTIP